MKKPRPDPETLLQHAKEEDQRAKRGKLKIYLGAAPGVGKTYSMLEDAIAKREKGLDIIVGIVESHGRKEIESLLKKFEILPRQNVEYHGQTLSEFDLDATLKRNPSTILIDEMAHTNVPGLRHNKRWQDIKEILDRGINVYTTLNVQHIESLNDIVTQIIHTRVNETIPDSMLEIADSVELIDLPPEDLLKRMQEGKVYIPQQAELAIEHFFRQGNLSALRELALRVTAERVGEQVLSYRKGKGIKFIWPTKEKLLVCVSSSQNATKLIRAARRMASSLQAEWIAVHVDTGFSEHNRAKAINNLRLAEQLGAETKILHGINATSEIIHISRELNVTKIIVGKRKHRWWKKMIFGNLTDSLIKTSDEIDIYMINDDSKKIKSSKYDLEQSENIFPWRAYALSLGVIGLATAINLIFSAYLQTTTIILVYIVTVTIVALLGKTGPSILASVLSVIAYGYFFANHENGFLIANTQLFFTLFIMLLVTQIISQLTIIMKKQTIASRLLEKRTSTLHALSRQLASARGVNKLLDIAVNYMANIFNSEVLALLSTDGHLEVKSGYGTKLVLNAKDFSVAQWVYDLGQIAGLGTDTLPFSDAIYVPLISSQKPIGVLRIKPKYNAMLFTPEQSHLLEACANQVALAIEVDRLHEQHKQLELESKTDRIRAALLEAVSHDMRTPLVAAIGSASTLMELSSDLNKHQIKKLSQDIIFELEQLNRLIHNFLQITYLEDNAVKLQKEFYPLSNVIATALKISYTKSGKKHINILLPNDLPKIPLDKTLIEEVFVNLIDNSMKFTPAESAIDIKAHLDNQYVVVSIEDNGPGIMPDEVNKLFEKFYRGRMLTTERGLGLGLSICRAIISAHGGKIWAENRKEGGAAFRFTLPLAP